MLRWNRMPTVVLLGATGSGKSTLVGKVTGLGDLSSSATTSFTRSAPTYTSSCTRLRVADTPGGDAMGETATEQIHNNMWIAQALSTDPVSLILVVVRAETRLDAVIGKVRPYLDAFFDFADNLAVCVTHMDTVTWAPEACSKHLAAQLDLSLAIYTSLNSQGDIVTEQLLQYCKQVEPLDITIDSDNFLKFFTIHDNNRRVLRSVKAEVDRFQAAVQQFHQELDRLNKEDHADAVFEFQAFMNAEIIHAKARVWESNNFEEQSRQPHASANVMGHTAHLMGQLQSLLVSVRKLAFKHVSEAGAPDSRQCPHCGRVWHLRSFGGRLETTCGKPVNRPDAHRLDMATFSFEIRPAGLLMEKRGYRPVQPKHPCKGAGCGQSIKWHEMKPMPPPHDVLGTDGVKVTTVEDIPMPSSHEQRSWVQLFADAYQTFGAMLSGMCHVVGGSCFGRGEVAVARDPSA